MFSKFAVMVPLDLGRDQDIQAAAAAEQLEQLANVELVHVHRHQPVAIELNLLLGVGPWPGEPTGAGPPAAGLPGRIRRRRAGCARAVPGRPARAWFGGRLNLGCRHQIELGPRLAQRAAAPPARSIVGEPQAQDDPV